jgi:periplasmic copper chaperone A
VWQPLLRSPCDGAREKEKSADMEYLVKQIIGALSGLAFMAVLVTAPARADEIKAGDLVITQAWSRATPGGAKIGGGYLTIENNGKTADRLESATSDIAGKVEVHEMSMDNGIMKMRPVEGGLTIDPGKTVKLAPGGYHLMIMDLKSQLKQGDKVAVTLKFEKAGNVSIVFDVAGIGATTPPTADPSPGQMDMKKMPDHSGMKM